MGAGHVIFSASGGGCVGGVGFVGVSVQAPIASSGADARQIARRKDHVK
jgi:hypothetical protein